MGFAIRLGHAIRAAAPAETCKAVNAENRQNGKPDPGLEGLAPPGPSGRGLACLSVAVATAGAGPDEAEALALLVVEEIGVDRGGEARVVELEA